MKIARIIQRLKETRRKAALFLLCAGLCTACGNVRTGQAEPVMGTTAPLQKETESEEKETKSSESETAQTGNTQTEADTTAPTQKEGELELAVQNESRKTMQEIYEEIVETVEQPEMITLNDNYIANYYGIDLSLLEDYFFASAQEVIYADTIVLMKVKEEASAQTVKDALDTMIAQKKLELENYLPEQFQIVEKSEVVVSGIYVYLVISEKAEEIQAVITQYLN